MTCFCSGQMLYPSQVLGNLPIGVKRVNSTRCIRLVSINESYCLTCKYSWISGQSALSFMIGSVSNRLAFKALSLEPRKAISISAHHDDPRSFAQIEINILDQHKGLTFDRMHSQRTNTYKSARGSRLIPLTISYTFYTRNTAYISARGI
jgi:hypothetical protein